MEECFETRKRELETGIGTHSEQKYENTGDQGRSGYCPFAADVLDIDCVVRDDTARHTHYGSDGVVAIDDTIFDWPAISRLGKVLWQKGVE